MRIRRATLIDASGGIDTIRRSITELCIPDHRGDMQKLGSWLSNKTVASWATWVAREDAVVLVSEQESKIVGVGMADFRGEILLNYVHPAARFSGVSKAILSALEEKLRTHDVKTCRLESTVTARRFYDGCGFRPIATNGFLLSKSL